MLPPGVPPEWVTIDTKHHRSVGSITCGVPHLNSFTQISRKTHTHTHILHQSIATSGRVISNRDIQLRIPTSAVDYLRQSALTRRLCQAPRICSNGLERERHKAERCITQNRARDYKSRTRVGVHCRGTWTTGARVHARSVGSGLQKLR